MEDGSSSENCHADAAAAEAVATRRRPIVHAAQVASCWLLPAHLAAAFCSSTAVDVTLRHRRLSAYY
eukprot:COSAG06_NODE_237_length_19433_cov_92.613961_10_plen_67_part_00